MKTGPAFFGAASGVTWNPVDTHAEITLSGGNLVATKTAANALRSTRATLGKVHTSQGYFEVLVGGTEVTGNFRLIGISTLTMPNSIGVGQDANGWAYYQETGQKVTNNVVTAYGATWTNGDVIGVAFNNGKVWFAKNNAYQGGGNPAAGTGEAFSGITGTLYPTASPYKGASAPRHVLTGCFSLGDFRYSPPSGFSAWA